MRGKKIVCLLCAVLLVFAAAGCGGPAPNQADTDAVHAAVEKFRGCTSFSVSQLTEIEELVAMDGERFVYNMLNEMEMSLIIEPSLQMKTTTSSKMEYDGEQIEQLSVSYVVPENGGYAEYISDGTEWYKLSTEEDVSLIGIGAASVVDTFFTDKIEFCKVSDVSLDSGKAALYEGMMGKEDLVALLESNGQLSGIESMSENQQAKIKENLVKDLDGVTVSVWVNEELGYPVRFEVSMAEVLNDMEKSIAKTLGNKVSEEEWKLEKYVISMNVSEFNAVDEIVPPPEAANAKLYEAE